jgi:glucosamine kinase
MILIADGGSTKTDWRLVSPPGETVAIQTIGFNPFLSTSAEIEEILWKELDPFLVSRHVKLVIYYGAGCSSVSKNEIVSNAFRSFFPEADIFIHHDLLAAARALCGDRPGIACILGTGSNSCLYDGHDVVSGMPSLGYFFGDEGSGAYLGKMLLTAYLHDELPPDLHAIFRNRYPLSLENILDAVYSKGKPSRFLASFSEFVSEYQQHPYINDLIHLNFAEFFKYFVVRYPNFMDFPVSCVGSIAFVYQSQLQEVANGLGFSIKQVLKSPIDGLVRYHALNQGI